MTLNDARSMNVDVLFERLVQFVRQELNVEDQRRIAEQLSEEELAIFDLLIQPDVALSEEDKVEVKKVVQELLETLKHEKLVLDWRKKQQAAVKKTVRDMFYYVLFGLVHPGVHALRIVLQHLPDGAARRERLRSENFGEAALMRRVPSRTPLPGCSPLCFVFAYRFQVSLR
ncbi:MAG TPA: type I restriction enzyme endonuclease domain-containing protein [Ktedonobacteraceae bacterium]